MTTEKALELVRKLFALADSENENESQDAMTKAQEIMLKYHLEQNDIGEEKKLADKMTTTVSFTFRSEPWVSPLSQIVAENFRCLPYLQPIIKQRYAVCLIGETDDLVLCNLTFKYAYESIARWCDNNKKIMKGDGRTPKEIRLANNGYAIGFIDGLSKMFDEQRNSDKKYGLVLKQPQSVLDKMEEIGLERKSPTKIHLNYNNYNSGYEDGRACNIHERVND